MFQVYIRFFCLLQVVPLILKFVESEMGIKFVQPPPFDIAKSFNDSNCLSPLIFILSPGVDPMAALSQFAQKMGFGAKFQSISLGQGQVSFPSVRMYIWYMCVYVCLP